MNCTWNEIFKHQIMCLARFHHMKSFPRPPHAKIYFQIILHTLQFYTFSQPTLKKLPHINSFQKKHSK